MDTTGLADLRNQMHSQETMLVPISDPKPREERLRPRSSHSHSDSSDSVSSTRSSNRSVRCSAVLLLYNADWLEGRLGSRYSAVRPSS